MQEHAEYKGYVINRGYEQRNDMNAHVIVLIEFAMSYCGYMPLTINYAGNSLFMEPYAIIQIFCRLIHDRLIIGIQRPVMIPVCATRRT